MKQLFSILMVLIMGGMLVKLVPLGQPTEPGTHTLCGRWRRPKSSGGDRDPEDAPHAFLAAD